MTPSSKRAAAARLLAALLAGGLALTGCTAGPAADGRGAADSGGAAATSAGSAGGASSASSGAGSSGEAAGDGSSGAANAVPDLAPPAANGAPHLPSPEVEAALAAMPGLYGLALLDVTLLEGRIDIEAAADCATVIDILQSGQWAVSAQAEGEDIALSLRRGGQTADGSLVETGSTCTGTLLLPAG